MNRTRIIPDFYPAVQPRDLGCLPVNRKYVAAMDARRALAAAPLRPPPARVAVADIVPCVRCGSDTLDEHAALCPDCSDERAGF